MTQLNAHDFVDRDGLIVRSGELLARKVIELLREGEVVRVQLRGLNGISSSYFNVLLRMIRDDLGADALQRVTLLFVSPLQQQVYERSLQAALSETSPL